ncbi:hypothetical protein [Escherichia coli]
MTTTQKTTDVTAPRRSHWWWTGAGMPGNGVTERSQSVTALSD